MTNVTQLSLPTPFEIGPVNCYIVSTDPLTIIDPGPGSEESYSGLQDGLEDIGLEIKDIDNILITHPHMDHFGGVAALASESGAQVISHEEATDFLVDPEEQFEEEREFFTNFFKEIGVPAETINTVLSLPEPYINFQEAATPDRTVTDGEILDVGAKLECIYTPGHAPGSVCYRFGEEGVVFTGDHLLPDTTPNPTLTVSKNGELKRSRSLPQYMTSLRKLQSVDESIGFGGHGGRIDDIHARTDEILAHHLKRKDEIANMIDDNPMTPYEIMSKVFPNLAMTESFAGLSEVIGHLDLLEEEDRIEWHENNGVREYSLSES